jgi:hypothetical protein
VTELSCIVTDVRADIFETSSMTGENIDEMFTKIVTDFHAEQKSQPPEPRLVFEFVNFFYIAYLT